MVVDSGLYVLRYISAASAQQPPFVGVAPKNAQIITLISVPGGIADGLSAPGDCIVVRAERSGALLLTATPAVEGGSLDAELKLERIANARSSTAPVIPMPTRAVAQKEAQPQISVLAHVSRRGDLALGADEWIGGPELPLAIEGVAVKWLNQPVDVELRCRATVRAGGQRRVLEGRNGDFVGTRGKAAPIVGLDLSLAGPGARNFELRVDALFLGAAIATKNGAAVGLTGPTGQEPLVGLRLTIAAKNQVKAPPRALPATTNTQPGKVKIYRSAAAAGM